MWGGGGGGVLKPLALVCLLRVCSPVTVMDRSISEAGREGVKMERVVVAGGSSGIIQKIPPTIRMFVTVPFHRSLQAVLTLFCYWLGD